MHCAFANARWARMGQSAAHGDDVDELIAVLDAIDVRLRADLDDDGGFSEAFPAHARAWCSLRARRLALARQLESWIRLLGAVHPPGSVVGVTPLLDDIERLDTDEADLLIDAHWIDVGEPG